MSQLSAPILRRSVRLLQAIHELHKQGYQNLAIYSGMSPSGMQWRCDLTPMSNLVITDGRIEVIDTIAVRSLSHSSADTGNHYFGWEDATEDSARQLAERIKARAPDLLRNAEGKHFAYAGWYTYMLGQAEQGALPVMYQENEEYHQGLIVTTKHSHLIQQPPHPRAWKEHGKIYFYTPAPHLKADQDWHEAYKGIIRNWRSSGICALPEYPLYTNDLYEIGAYWEGAVYYIQKVLGFTRIDDYLGELARDNGASERWSTFHAAWNSSGQLCFLNAFLVRFMLNDGHKYQLRDPERKRWETWLIQFEDDHMKQRLDGISPYHGGQNPLHLGLILQEEHGEKLIGL